MEKEYAIGIDLGGTSVKYALILMEKEYAIGIDLGGTSVKYALLIMKAYFTFKGSYRRKPMYQQKLSSDSWLLLSMK